VKCEWLGGKLFKTFVCFDQESGLRLFTSSSSVQAIPGIILAVLGIILKQDLGETVDAFFIVCHGHYSLFSLHYSSSFLLLITAFPKFRSFEKSPNRAKLVFC
jgi:hypothetical protein